MKQDELSHRQRLDMITEYVRDRLQKECSGLWGREGELAKRIGYSQAQISNVKEGRRGVGRAMALSLAMYWGLSYDQLERVAIENWERDKLKREQAADSAHANLAATVEYLKGSYPDAYLAEYLTHAKHLRHDRPKEVWIQDIQVQFHDWRAHGALPYREVAEAEASTIVQQDPRLSAAVIAAAATVEPSKAPKRERSGAKAKSSEEIRRQKKSKTR